VSVPAVYVDNRNYWLIESALWDDPYDRGCSDCDGKRVEEPVGGGPPTTLHAIDCQRWRLTLAPMDDDGTVLVGFRSDSERDARRTVKAAWHNRATLVYFVESGGTELFKIFNDPVLAEWRPIECYDDENGRTRRVCDDQLVRPHLHSTEKYLSGKGMR